MYFDWSNDDASNGIFASFCSCWLQAGVSRKERFLPLAFAEARATPGFGCDRQPECPARRNRHQSGEFVGAAEADRRFANDLIVHMQYGAIAGALDADERCG